MSAGSLLNATGCTLIAVSHGIPSYIAAWLCLGLGMRLTLYDAAFAALARIGGRLARGPISQITLLGGLSSTVFWPIGHLLSVQFGWRQALFAYAGFALLAVPLERAIPTHHYEEPVPLNPDVPQPPPALVKGQLRLAGGLFALVVALANFLNAGMAAYMIAILGGFGLGAALAVQVSALRGVRPVVGAALRDSLRSEYQSPHAEPGRMPPHAPVLRDRPVQRRVDTGGGDIRILRRGRQRPPDHRAGNTSARAVRLQELWRHCGATDCAEFRSGRGGSGSLCLRD